MSSDTQINGVSNFYHYHCRSLSLDKINTGFDHFVKTEDSLEFLTNIAIWSSQVILIDGTTALLKQNISLHQTII